VLVQAVLVQMHQIVFHHTIGPEMLDKMGW
jgi:hypothetical protein